MDLPEIDRLVAINQKWSISTIMLPVYEVAEMSALIKKQEQALADKDLALMEQTEIAQAANRQAEEWTTAWHDLRGDVLIGVDGFDSDQVNTVLGMLDNYEPVAAPQQHAQAAQLYANNGQQHEDPTGPNHPGHHDGHTCEAMGQMLADFGSQRTTPEAVVAGMDAQAALSDEQIKELAQAHSAWKSKDKSFGVHFYEESLLRFTAAVLANRQPAPIDRAAIHRKVLERGMDGPDVVGPTVCTVPPPGWYCTRVPGHDGPCAAHPAAPVAAAVQGDALIQQTPRPIGYIVTHDSAGGNYFPINDTSSSYKGMKEVYKDRCQLVYSDPPMLDSERDAALDKAVADVIAERQRQIQAEGMERQYDDNYRHGELRRAAAVYAYPQVLERDTTIWPWAQSWMKHTNPRRDAVKAAALLMAEIERIDRLAAQPHKKD